ncbi:MAG: phosphoribosylformylglycinamidine cyclo-ligase [Coriobacteriaceae bacterium]|nr:phosphoribosylformylglycinamidine cyclo-ligase [Coriobacteriaceae bacterium]
MADEQITYKDAGVDIDEGARAVQAIRGAVQSTYRPEVIGDIGGFGGLFSAAAFKDMEDPIMVSGTDGVGTKLQLAQMIDRHDSCGIDLVAMCVNDVLACGAEPLFFLDYVAIGKLKAEQMAQIVGGIAEGCKQANCSLVGGEIAEHPGVMPEDDYDLSGFCVGVVDRPKMIGPELVEEGDVILGLASTGIHSNGFSLVRRAVTERKSLDELTAPCEQLGGTSVMDALLAPTRIYVKSIINLLKKGLPVHAVAHITGGGITENLDRALPKTLDAQVELGSWPVLPIIQYVIDAAGLDQEQALKTFNMGIGMCVICKPADAAAIQAELEATGEKVYTVGTVIAGEGKVVYR